MSVGLPWRHTGRTTTPGWPRRSPRRALKSSKIKQGHTVIPVPVKTFIPSTQKVLGKRRTESTSSSIIEHRMEGFSCSVIHILPPAPLAPRHENRMAQVKAATISILWEDGSASEAAGNHLSRIGCSQSAVDRGFRHLLYYRFSAHLCCRPCQSALDSMISQIAIHCRSRIADHVLDSGGLIPVMSECRHSSTTV